MTGRGRMDSSSYPHYIRWDCYEYDAGGNLTCNGAYESEFGAGNRLTWHNGIDAAFDADGNMTSGPLDWQEGEFEYDELNRLISAGGSMGLTGYAYDGEGTRVSSGGITYVTDPNSELSQLLITHNEDGSTTYYVYAPGFGLISQETFRDEGSPEYRLFYYDLRGSTVALADMHGITDRFSYTPYGAAYQYIGWTETIFLFAGQHGVQTDANGLIYMRARYYSPELGLFINEDPIRDGLNWYAYAGGNPVNRIDPTGLFYSGFLEDLEELWGIVTSEEKHDHGIQYLHEQGIGGRVFAGLSNASRGTAKVVGIVAIAVVENVSIDIEFGAGLGGSIYTPK